MRRRRGPTGLPFLALAVLAATGCAPITASPAPAPAALAGRWEGWTATGLGGARHLTVTIRADGSYEAVGADGGAVAGRVWAAGRGLRWADTTGQSGPLRLIERPEARVLRGLRGDGTLPFEWRQPRPGIPASAPEGAPVR